MWRTATTLLAAGVIRIPVDLRPFIEPVYGGEDVPECLKFAQWRSVGDSHRERYLASSNLIKFEQSRDGRNPVGSRIPSAQGIVDRKGQAQPN